MTTENKWKRWTEAEDNVLRSMRSAGVPYRDCARILKRTEGSCYNRAHGLGFAKPHAIDAPVITHEEMYSSEPTTWIGRIKRLLGVSDIGAQ